MCKRRFNERELTVYIDRTNPVFAERLIKLMTDSGVSAQAFALPKRRSELLGWTCRLKRSKPILIHYLWGNHGHLIYIISKLAGKKIIIHWIGTDVVCATSYKKWTYHGILRKIAYRIADLHLVDFEPLAVELRSLGIEAEVIPLVPDMPPPVEDVVWPREDRLFVDLPETELELYGGDTIFKLTQELPDIEFLIARHSGRGAPSLPNVKYLGYVDNLEPIWKQVKVYLRLTKHDGLAHGVVEALARGRHVVWSQSLPYCHKASTFEEALDVIRSILRQNQPNIDGMHYARSEFDPLRIAENLKRAYLKVIEDK